ncbi:MAG: DUF4159 domain-containing protein [Candidatus Eisenbacteria bacterium]|nr:DUF4159 domain-containing protein [Candidatus Eisenbacteria bacterium]
MRLFCILIPRTVRSVLLILGAVSGLPVSLGSLLHGSGIPLASVSTCWAATKTDAGFIIARLKYKGGGDWYGNATSLRNLMNALRVRGNVVVKADKEATVEIMDGDLFNHPFLFMSGHGTVRFTQKEAERLRSYLLKGGFLFADDDYGMDKTFREEMKRVFPEKDLIELPFNHKIYHSFYDFPNGPPKIHEHDGKPPQGLAIVDKGRVLVFYTYETDIGDGLEDADIHNDPPEKREAALRMAINIVTYALTD